MSKFIQDFFNGKFEPCARKARQDSEAQRISETLSRNEEVLMSILTGNDLKLFQDYVKAWGDLLTASDEDSFVSGFRLGARFALDTFASEDRPHCDTANK